MDVWNFPAFLQETIWGAAENSLDAPAGCVNRLALRRIKRVARKVCATSVPASAKE